MAEMKVIERMYSAFHGIHGDERNAMTAAARVLLEEVLRRGSWTSYADDTAKQMLKELSKEDRNA